MLLLIVAGIGVAVYLFRRQQPPRMDLGYRHYPVGPEDMLAARFAHGEISEEEYLSRLAVLRRRGPADTGG